MKANIQCAWRHLVLHIQLCKYLTLTLCLVPTHPLSQLCLEVVEDEVRVRLWHGAHVRDVMTHHSLGQVEGGRGPIGKVTNDETICMRKENTHSGASHSYVLVTLPGSPLCSCTMIKSVTLLARQACTSCVMTKLPLFNRWALGKISLSSYKGGEHHNSAVFLAKQSLC